MFVTEPAYLLDDHLQHDGEGVDEGEGQCGHQGWRQKAGPGTVG